jgi:phosphatidylinositol-3,4,5-trisphosphate 3-phosphatase/dual-specificity protein phosphatase PTEN
MPLFQGFYRNHMEEVIRFFEMHHKVVLLSVKFVNLYATWTIHVKLLRVAYTYLSYFLLFMLHAALT